MPLLAIKGILSGKRLSVKSFCDIVIEKAAKPA